MKTRFFVITLFLLSVLILAACSSGTGSDGAAAPEMSTAAIPQSGGALATATQPATLPSNPEPTTAASPTVGVMDAPTDVQQAEPTNAPTVAVEQPTATTQAAVQQPVANCTPTAPDALGPFYKPGAPERNKVGDGYVLEGAVFSVDGCTPVANAQVELWMAGPDGEYRDEYRATIIADEQGRYRFESHAPPPYSGRPPHIHLRISAPGYQTLVTQHYPTAESTGATFDLVLQSE